PICYGLPGCSAPCTDLTGFPANGAFYFQAFSGSVALPAAGYDYNSDWTPLLMGLSPIGTAASLAAPRAVLFGPGRARAPRITAPLMLRSTNSTVSAPAIKLFRGSITHPTQLLCTLRGRRYRRLTQHSLPSSPLRPYSDRSFTGWTEPAKLAPSEL